MTLYGAVDPGKAGAVVIIDEARNPVLVWAADDKGSNDRPAGYLVGDFDARGFVAELERAVDGRPFGGFICEAPFVLRSGGVSSALTIGKNYGALTACLSVARLPWQEVTPASWSVKMVGAPPKGGWPDKAKKQAAIDLCRRELPLLNLILPGRRVPHDGIADAGAMCLYAMRGAK